MIPAPIDAAGTRAWAGLHAHQDSLTPDLRTWFAEDPDRAQRFAFRAGDLHVDLSKNLITDRTVELLLQLADEVGLTGRIEAMFSGGHINVTEDRAVLHTALRRPAGATPALHVDGQDVDADVHAELDKMYAFANKVRSGEWTGITGKPVRTVVNIGIGGSDLGPVMAYEALRPYVADHLQVRFISNIDPTDVAETTKDLDPETTLFIVASKTFGTLETLTNARLAREWLWEKLAAAGVLADTQEARTEAVTKHFVAVSTALDKVADFGIDPANAFGFWDWVGGRYSVDSVIGTSLAVAIGPDHFAEFLAGFHTIDEHFRSTPFARNVPALMGLLNVWYTNFLDAQTHAVLPYAQYLHRFPAYLQQLTMESNGKGVRWDGSPVTTDTGEVFWGEPGTNGQHAFYQLIHQGTRVIPADFIAMANPAHPLTDGGDGLGGEQLAGVRVLRVLDHRLDRTTFDGLPGVHHLHRVRQVTGAGDVVGDVEHGEILFVAETTEQVQDVEPDGDVQHRDGLIGQQHLGVDRQRPRDHQPLALSTGQLVRVGVDQVRGRGEVDPFHQLEHALLELLTAVERVVQLERSFESVPDRLLRVQGTEGVLEDQLDTAVVLPVSELVLGLDGLTVQQDLPRGERVELRQEPGQRGLAAPGLPHQRHDLPPAQLERCVFDGVDRRVTAQPTTDLEVLGDVIGLQHHVWR